MGNERWQRVEEHFARLSDLDPAERQQALVALGTSEPDLVAEVESLLAAARPDGVELTDVFGRAHGALSAPSRPDALEGRRIGPYRVVRELGSGGMGSVYLCERVDETYQAQVALKLLRAPLAGSELERRFRAERQILAQLSHAGIARLLDGGTTEQGVPYLVMEYVAGLPVTDFVRERTLSFDARLRLFMRICEAVQYAHARLVVHRDLKPANILVDEEGMPKLLDFGIAKLIGDAEAAFDAATTRTGMRVMTPLYASPEQVRGEPITVATDVYALGVLLYELLTDRLPYKEDPRDTRAVERAIVDRDPARPSEALATELKTQVDSPESTRQRAVRALRGDLDTIVLKALQKDAARRYASVEALRDDIGRHLEGLPVRARPDRWTYRTGKFVRRNRGIVVSGLALLLTILFFTAGTVLQSIQLERQRDLARRERDQAQAVADFLADVFRASEPSESLGAEATARELLDRGAERIRSDGSLDGDLRATLLGVIGDVYRQLNLQREGIPLLEASLTELRALRTAPDAELARGEARLGSAYAQLGDFERGLPLIREAYEQVGALDDLPSQERVNVINTLGSYLTRAGIYEEARARLNEALAVAEGREDRNGADDVEWTVLNNLGQLETSVGDHEASLAYHRRVLREREAALSPLHPSVLSSLNNSALVLERLARYSESDSLYQVLVERAAQVHGTESPYYATYLNNLASFYKRIGQPERAEPLQRRALEIFVAVQGEESADVAMSYNNLANLLHDLGRPSEAVEMHRKALALNLRLYGENHDRVAGSYNNLAAALRDLGDLDGAIENYRATLEIDRRTVGEDHPFLASDRVNLASALSARGDFTEATALFDSAAAIHERVLQPEHTDNALRLVEVGIHLLRQGRAEAALPLLRSGLEIDEAALPESSTQIAYARTALGAALVRTGERQQGLGLLQLGYHRLVEAAGPQARGSRQARAWMEEAGVRVESTEDGTPSKIP
ncbi:MAG: serine/threonine-protein kinase [Gemmatimonadota bacterium]